MTWIKTISSDEADEKLAKALEVRFLYPPEYAMPVPGAPDDEKGGIVASHSLIPDALYHSFAAFAVLLSPELKLTRQQHEMITTVVSVTNQCHY